MSETTDAGIRSITGGRMSEPVPVPVEPEVKHFGPQPESVAERKADSARLAARKRELARELFTYRPEMVLKLECEPGVERGSWVFFPVLPGDTQASISYLHPAAGSRQDMLLGLADYRRFAEKMLATLGVVQRT